MKDNIVMTIMIGTVILVLVVIFSILIPHSIDRSKACHDNGGIMVKSEKGWICIDAKVLK